jgi:hypothetical protein
VVGGTSRPITIGGSSGCGGDSSGGGSAFALLKMITGMVAIVFGPIKTGRPLELIFSRECLGSIRICVLGGTATSVLTF